MFKNSQLTLLKIVIDLNEKVFFERKLHKFYKKNRSNQTVIDL